MSEIKKEVETLEQNQAVLNDEELTQISGGQGDGDCGNWSPKTSRPFIDDIGRCDTCIHGIHGGCDLKK